MSEQSKIDAELLPCPHCNGGAEMRLYDSEYFVQCVQCFASTAADHQTEQEAAEKWNRRSLPVGVPDGWIAVTDCMPERGKPVQVWCDGSDSAGVAWRADDAWYMPEPQALGYESITHWQPLAAAPTVKASLSAAERSISCTKPDCFPYCDCGGVDDPAPTVKAERVPLDPSHRALIKNAIGLLRIRRPAAPDVERVAADLELMLAGHATPADKPSAEWLEVAALAEAPSLPAAGSAVEEVDIPNISYALRERLLGQLAGDHEPEEVLCVEDFYSWLAKAIDNIRAEYRKAEGSKPVQVYASSALSAQQSAPATTPEQDGKLLVSAEPLRQVLNALVSAPHMIRELQATREPVALFSDNPINVLIAEFNAAHGGE